MYIVSPAEKKSIEEKVFFTHENGRHARLIIHWRTGKVWCEEEPDLSDYSESEGADMSFLVEYVDEEQIDGWDFTIESDDDISEEEKESMENAWNDSLEAGMKELGWVWNDRELWFYGPLDVEEE
jgi:hypothetical protein